MSYGSASSSLVDVGSIQRSIIESSLKQRKPGDMIRMQRAGFLHYAIYIGNNKIVDFVADNGGEVRMRNLFETVGDSICAIDNYLDNCRPPSPQTDIVRRAKVATKMVHIYDLATNNCKHFATWCRYDYPSCMLYGGRR